jgi:hypothetical protein
MTKTKTTAKLAPAAAASPVLTIRELFLGKEIVSPQVLTWTEFLEIQFLDLETRYLVNFETGQDWSEFCVLIGYDRKKRTIPGNRDEKPGHAKTLREKDIPSLEAYDYRRGQASINVETMNLIDHGHRFRILDEHKTKNPDNPVIIALRFTTATADGFDGTQAKWTVADQSKTALKLADMTDEAASFYSSFMQQAGNVVRLRLQGLNIEGGGQSAHKQGGHTLTSIQETRCWDYDPLYLGLWNLTSKDPSTPSENPTSSTGRTLVEIVQETELYTNGGKDLQKCRIDLLLIAMVDACPECFEDFALVRKLLDRFETQLSLIGNAYQPFQTFKRTAEEKYFWMVALWKTLRANHAPKAETISEHNDDSYPDGIQKIAKKLKAEREEALKTILSGV